ncbi:MAG: T9SS type A sorting domain-containing protein [Ignavibacteria bacterium]|nr:T9SS type A sorting domain-containing protein [Ignavibacteria bacterium]
MTRYIKERDNSTYQIISSTNQLIEINVTDNLDNEIYNYQLSAYIKIPVNWQYVRTEQNGVIDTLTTLLTDTGRVVLAKVIPDGGILKVTPINPTTVDDEILNVEKFQLFQNYPNPFNPSTKITYTIPNVISIPTGRERNLNVVLKVFDILGNEVVTLVNENKPAGTYEVEFSTIGGSASGGNVAQSAAADFPAISSGVYFYRLNAGSYIETKKMILLR